MFEHRKHPLLPRQKFLLRMLRTAGIAAAVVCGGLGLGVVGYHVTEKMPWLDALLNAAMILFGLGPVDPIRTTGGKLFASFYAMFSGVVFLTVTALLLAPLFHRMIHKFHLELAEEDESDRRPPPREQRGA
jgi:hypothetical protein